MTTPDLAADTITILAGFGEMVASTDRYPGKDEFGDRRTAECLEHARQCVTGLAQAEARASDIEARYDRLTLTVAGLTGRGRTLTAADPEPPPGTVVTDSGGREWYRSGEGDYWLRQRADYTDPESWTKVAGNYGPVTVLEWGDTETVEGGGQ